MPKIVKDDAIAIAKKLRKVKPVKPGRQMFNVIESSGGKHLLVTIEYVGMQIAQYGIKHSPDRNAGHGWIPGEIHLSPQQAYDFAKCSLSVDEYIDVLVAKGEIVDS